MARPSAILVSSSSGVSNPSTVESREASAELYEARHEGAAGEAVGPVQPPDPPSTFCRNLSRLPSTPSSTCMPRKGTSFLKGRGEAKALRGVRPAQALPPTFMRVGGAQSKWSCSSGEGAGSSPPRRRTPGSPGQRDVVDGVEPRLRPEGVPVALHHVRQGVEVAVVELAEGLPLHDVGGVDGQPVVLCAHRFSSQHAVVAVLLPHRGHLPRLGAAEVLEGHGQLAQDAVPRLLQVAVRPPLFERPSLGRRVGRRAQLQLGVKRGHLREELRLLGKTFMLSTNLSGPHCRHFSPDLQRTRRQRSACRAQQPVRGFGAALAMGMGLSGSLPS